LTAEADLVIRIEEAPDRVETAPCRLNARSVHPFAVRLSIGFSKRNGGSRSPLRSTLVALGCLIVLILAGCASAAPLGGVSAFHGSVPVSGGFSLLQVWSDARTALQVSETPANLVRLRTTRGVDNRLTYLELVASLGDGREVALVSTGTDEGLLEVRGSVRDGMISEGPPVEDVLAGC